MRITMVDVEQNSVEFVTNLGHRFVLDSEELDEISDLVARGKSSLGFLTGEPFSTGKNSGPEVKVLLMSAVGQGGWAHGLYCHFCQMPPVYVKSWAMTNVLACENHHKELVELEEPE